MTDLEERSIIERLARHLATAGPSDWAAHVEDAASIVALLKEPDAAMRQAGDASTWRAMIDAALTERWTLPQTVGAVGDHQPGADEEGEIALHPGDANMQGRAAWVHIDKEKRI
jgi:hypothetical protein